MIDLDTLDRAMLPDEVAVTALTMAELAAGPFAALPFDDEAARAYGRVYASVTASRRKARGARALDLMIAAIACSVGQPLYTRNPSDFAALEDLVEIVAL
ncbi:hypothetical protein BH23ACT6_BH23ACT6_16350 [soil metagenome]